MFFFIKWEMKRKVKKGVNHYEGGTCGENAKVAITCHNDICLINRSDTNDLSRVSCLSATLSTSKCLRRSAFMFTYLKTFKTQFSALRKTEICSQIACKLYNAFVKRKAYLHREQCWLLLRYRVFPLQLTVYGLHSIYS